MGGLVSLSLHWGCFLPTGVGLERSHFPNVVSHLLGHPHCFLGTPLTPVDRAFLMVPLLPLSTNHEEIDPLAWALLNRLPSVLPFNAVSI